MTHEPEVADLDDSPFSDFLGFELLLEEQDRELLSRVRAFMTREVEPVINEHWTRGEFPHQLVPQIAELGIAGLERTVGRRSRHSLAVLISGCILTIRYRVPERCLPVGWRQA